MSSSSSFACQQTLWASSMSFGLHGMMTSSTKLSGETRSAWWDPAQDFGLIRHWDKTFFFWEKAIRFWPPYTNNWRDEPDWACDKHSACIHPRGAWIWLWGAKEIRVYEQVMDAIMNDKALCVFLSARGGCGKTYLLNLILSAVRAFRTRRMHSSGYGNNWHCCNPSSAWQNFPFQNEGTFRPRWKVNFVNFSSE